MWLFFHSSTLYSAVSTAFSDKLAKWPLCQGDALYYFLDKSLAVRLYKKIN